MTPKPSGSSIALPDGVWSCSPCPRYALLDAPDDDAKRHCTSQADIKHAATRNGAGRQYIADNEKAHTEHTISQHKSSPMLLYVLTPKLRKPTRPTALSMVVSTTSGSKEPAWMTNSETLMTAFIQNCSNHSGDQQVISISAHNYKPTAEISLARKEQTRLTAAVAG